jgi:hypothetical protein
MIIGHADFDSDNPTARAGRRLIQNMNSAQRALEDARRGFNYDPERVQWLRSFLEEISMHERSLIQGKSDSAEDLRMAQMLRSRLPQNFETLVFSVQPTLKKLVFERKYQKPTSEDIRSVGKFVFNFSLWAAEQLTERVSAAKPLVEGLA